MRFPSFLSAATVPVFLVSLVSLTGGCEEEMRPPPPPVMDASAGDSRIIGPPPPRDDSSTADGAMDGAMDAAMDATSDAALPPGCFVAGAGTGTTADITSGGETFPFFLDRSYATWDPNLCTTVPTVIVGLTEGSCTPSVGDQLIFSMAEEAIGTAIFVGTNTLVAEPDDFGLTVRFRSVGVGGGSEEWGTCAGSSGTIDFTSISSVVGERLTATYDMILTDCRAPLTSPPIAVTGSFDLPLEVAFETICL